MINRSPGRWSGTDRRGAVGRVLTSQLALVIVLVALPGDPAGSPLSRHGTGAVSIGTIGPALLAVILLAVTWLRWRGRALSGWLAVGIRYLLRRRVLASRAGGPGPLDRLTPEIEVDTVPLAGTTAGVLRDQGGLTAVLEIDDPGVTGSVHTLPPPIELLPARDGPGSPEVILQLLITGAAAPTPDAAELPARAYRQLCGDGSYGRQRVLLAVRVVRAGTAEPDLVTALSAAVRAIRRRLGPLPAVPLRAAALRATVADLTGLEPAGTVAEEWRSVRTGSGTHLTYRLVPDPPAITRLLPRLAAVPATATTVSIRMRRLPTADGLAADATVRVTAPSPAAVAAVDRAVRRACAEEHLGRWALPGEQLPGLIATLPLGRGPTPTPVRPDAAALSVPLGHAGLMVGRDRHGAPVAVPLFRPEPTRTVLIGELRTAQLVVLRALALGAEVSVRTGRPAAWRRFVDGLGPAAAVTLHPLAGPPPGPPNAPNPPPGPPNAPGTADAANPRPGTSNAAGPFQSATARRPVLLLVDGGPPTWRADDPGWLATLVVHAEVTPVTGTALTQADLVILPRLEPAAAELAGSALGLADAAGWFPRIGPDMVGLVRHGHVRWARLAASPIESTLVARPPVPIGRGGP